jgi:hypothetical protein
MLPTNRSCKRNFIVVFHIWMIGIDQSLPLQLFTRLPVDDSADSGLSSFMVEMTDIAYLLENVTNTSLVIMDELGRGNPYLIVYQKWLLIKLYWLATATSDALAIATAVCEELVETKACPLKMSCWNIHNLI